MAIIFYGMIVIAVVITVLIMIVGIAAKPKLLWLAGILWYVTCFLGSMSIGLYLLVIPSVLWTLAFAHLFRLLKNRSSYGLSVGVGVLFWMVSITMIDDYWLFFPFSWLLG